MDVFLETERLILRRFTMDDIDDLVELDGDPEVMFHLSGGLPTSREKIESDYLPGYLAYYRTFPGYGFWAVIEKHTDEFVGWFHFRPAPGHPVDEPELGYRFRRPFWGRGYGTEGSIALIDRGFADLGVRRVVASAMVVNVASWRVMEKSGMRRIRVFHSEWPHRMRGDEQGDVEYAITRAEWEAHRARRQ